MDLKLRQNAHSDFVILQKSYDFYVNAVAYVKYVFKRAHNVKKSGFVYFDVDPGLK